MTIPATSTTIPNRKEEQRKRPHRNQKQQPMCEHEHTSDKHNYTGDDARNTIIITNSDLFIRELKLLINKSDDTTTINNTSNRTGSRGITTISDDNLVASMAPTGKLRTSLRRKHSLKLSHYPSQETPFLDMMYSIHENLSCFVVLYTGKPELVQHTTNQLGFTKVPRLEDGLEAPRAPTSS